MQLRGKGLKWLKDLKESVRKEMVGLWQQGEEKCQDRELKEYKMGRFECPVSEVVNPEQRKLNKVLKVGGIKLPGLGIECPVSEVVNPELRNLNTVVGRRKLPGLGISGARDKH